MNKKLYRLYNYLSQNNLSSEAYAVYDLIKSADGSDDCWPLSDDDKDCNNGKVLIDPDYEINTVKTKFGFKVHLEPTSVGIGSDSNEGERPKVSKVLTLDSPIEISFSFARGDKTSEVIKNICEEQAPYKGSEDIKDSFGDSFVEDFMSKNTNLQNYIESISVNEIVCNSTSETVSVSYTLNPKPNLSEHKICICLLGEGVQIIAKIAAHPSNPDLPNNMAEIEHDDPGPEVRVENGDSYSGVTEDYERITDGVLRLDGKCESGRSDCVDLEFNIDIEKLFQLYTSSSNKSYSPQYRMRNDEWTRVNSDYTTEILDNTQSFVALQDSSVDGFFRRKEKNDFTNTRDIILQSIRLSGKNPLTLLKEKKSYFDQQMKRIFIQIYPKSSFTAGHRPTPSEVRNLKSSQQSDFYLLKYFGDYIFEYFLYHYSLINKDDAETIMMTIHDKIYDRVGTGQFISTPNISNYPQ